MKGDERMISVNNFNESELNTTCTVQFKDLLALINRSHFYSDLSKETAKFGNIQKGILYDYGLISTNPFGVMTLAEAKELLKEVPSRLSSFKTRTDYKDLCIFVIKENESNVKYVDFSLCPAVDIAKEIPITKTIMKYINWTSLTEDEKVSVASSCIGCSLDDFRKIFPSTIPAKLLSSVINVDHYVFPYLYYDKLLKASDDERFETWSKELSSVSKSVIDQWIKTFPAFFHVLPSSIIIRYADVFKREGGQFTVDECKILVKQSYKISIEEILDYNDDELLKLYLTYPTDSDIMIIIKRHPELIKQAPYNLSAVRGLLNSGKTLSDCFNLLVKNENAYTALKTIIDSNTSSEK